LELRKWSNVALDLLPDRCDIQVDLLESFQHAFCGGLRRSSFRVSGIQPCQFFIPFGQTTPDVKLEQGQDAQPDGQQPDQAGSSTVILQVHGGQRQGLTFEPSKAAFHQIFFPVGQDRLFQGKLFDRSAEPGIEVGILAALCYEPGPDPAKLRNWPEIAESLGELVKRLPERLQGVITANYGLEDGKPQSLQAIGCFCLLLLRYPYPLYLPWIYHASTSGLAVQSYHFKEC
jgi:hypothetical protein